MLRRPSTWAVAAVALLGSGVTTARPSPAATPATSEWGCDDWGMYGRDLARTFSADCPDSINPATVATLVPAWVFDTPKPVTATPAVVDGVVYVGAWDGVMYALDAGTGAVQWRYQTTASPGATYGPIVSSAAVADVAFAEGTRRLVIFGAGPRVYALEATTGEAVWLADASAGVAATPVEYESSPLVWEDIVLIGRDTHDEPVSLTGGVRGGLVALDVRTGAERWRFEPELDQPGLGCGGVWGSPTLDSATGRVYFGAANCPVDEFAWNAHTNAVTALDAHTGAPLWTFQPKQPPDDDTDFGATPNLFVDSTGRTVLGAGKKDGTYYALDPKSGAPLWQTHVADPAPNIGGFIGSPAAWHGDVFGGTAIGSPPYLHSLDGATGAVRWQGGIGPTYGATSVVNGVVLNAALDDVLKAYEAETGRLLWVSPLTGPGSSGAVAVGDMVFVGAGTSTSDACAKGEAYDDLCVFVFDEALAALGGVHAYRLAVGGA